MPEPRPHIDSEALLAEVLRQRDTYYAALVRCDSLLSLLRYRLERTIPWGTLGIPTKDHVDEVIAQSRRAQQRDMGLAPPPPPAAIPLPSRPEWRDKS